MARFYGKVGFVRTVETTPGVWTNEVTEKSYKGDVTRSYHKWENGESINDDVNISNSISIVADSYAYNNSYAMKYVKWMGTAWKINSIDFQHPRLILSIGGVYNGEQVESA